MTTTQRPSEVVQTDRWLLRVPDVPDLGRTIYVPTVHPVGDQRVLRCAQAALDMGYSIHFIWLGSSQHTVRRHERITETRLETARSVLSRMLSVPRGALGAWRADADLWHIHDFYLLPLAWAWSRMARRPVVYDVHEYYPEYYSSKVRPRALRRLAESAIRSFELGTARRLAGANAVSHALAERFRAVGVPAVATPNYPAENASYGSRQLVPELLNRVVHTGTISHAYGAHIIVESAVQLQKMAPHVQLVVVGRYHTDADRTWFAEVLRRSGNPSNLTVIDPVPAHQIAPLLSTFGIGISALQAGGQNGLAIPTKLYEYVNAGLAIVASDLDASRTFVERYAAGGLFLADDPMALARGIAEVVSAGRSICAAVNRATKANAGALEWENGCAPALQQLFTDACPADR